MDGHAFRSLRIITLRAVLGPAVTAQPGELRAFTIWCYTLSRFCGFFA